MKMKSNFGDIWYEPSECCIICNPSQAAAYIERGNVYPVDMYAKDGKLNYIFDKKATTEIYILWLKHEL